MTMHRLDVPVFFFFDGGMLLIQTIISEMGKGNFSFLILLVGVLQLIVMMIKRR